MHFCAHLSFSPFDSTDCWSLSRADFDHAFTFSKAPNHPTGSVPFLCWMVEGTHASGKEASSLELCCFGVAEVGFPMLKCHCLVICLYEIGEAL